MPQITCSKYLALEIHCRQNNDTTANAMGQVGASRSDSHSACAFSSFQVPLNVFRSFVECVYIWIIPKECFLLKMDVSHNTGGRLILKVQYCIQIYEARSCLCTQESVNNTFVSPRRCIIIQAFAETTSHMPQVLSVRNCHNHRVSINEI